jgi:hypothetical protein
MKSRVIFCGIMIMATAFVPVLRAFSVPTPAQGEAVVPKLSTPAKSVGDDLETKKYLLEVRKADIEEQKARDARSLAKWTAAAIFVPLILGFASLYWQARLQGLQSKVSFQLKAAEVVLDSKSTRAGEDRAKALRELFPDYVPVEFSKAFASNNFRLPGLAYQEKKLELFRMLASNLDHRRAVFEAYAMVYADEGNVLTEFIDKWKNAYPNDTQWVGEFVQQWNRSYPEGKWPKKSA